MRFRHSLSHALARQAGFDEKKGRKGLLRHGFGFRVSGLEIMCYIMLQHSNILQCTVTYCVVL